MGVDSKLFQIMTLVGKDEIVEIDGTILTDLNITNNGNIYTNWEIEAYEFGTYLRGHGESSRGEYKITFQCTSDKETGQNKILGTAGFESSNPEWLVKHAVNTTGIFIDSAQVELKILPTALNEYIMAVFVVGEEELAFRLSSASEIGVYMQPLNKDVFAGFKIKQTKKSQEAMRNIFISCFK